MNDVMLRYVTN